MHNARFCAVSVSRAPTYITVIVMDLVLRMAVLLAGRGLLLQVSSTEAVATSSTGAGTAAPPNCSVSVHGYLLLPRHLDIA